MIFPTQNISFNQSFLGAGAIILKHLDKPKNIKTLWEEVRDISGVNNFDKFVLVLDFLYIIGAIDLKNSMLVIKK